MARTAPDVAAADEQLLDHRYRLQRPVAASGDRSGWGAIDERLGRAVTVRSAAPEGLPVAAVRRYSCLTDDRLIRVLDLDPADVPQYLVTDLYRGASFASLLSGGLLTVGTAVDLVAEAAAAVATVHAADLVYGSLTTESICWTECGLVKLLDVPLAPAGAVAAAHDVEALQRVLRSALDPEVSPELITTLRNTYGTATELVAALEPFRPAGASLRRSLVSAEPVGAPHRLARCSVREVMATDVMTVSEDTPILELAELLTRCRHVAVPVVDAAGRVTGMISSADLAHWRLGTVSV